MIVSGASPTRLSTLLPGFAAAVPVAAVGYVAGRAEPVIGGPAAALALGLGVAAVLPPLPELRPGLRFAGRYVLQAAIVLLGATLSLGEVGHVGRGALPVMTVTLLAAFVVAAVFGALLAVSERMRLLVGVGTGICGASAIAAVATVVPVADADVAYAMTTIFVFNIAAVVAFPLLGHGFGLSQRAFGIWAGTAINDTSSVVAAAYGYGSAAGSQAVVIKLVRTLAIVPVVVGLVVSRRGTRPARWRSLVPWFILFFLVACAMRTAGSPPDGSYVADKLPVAATALTTVALASVGLSTRLQDTRALGVRPLVLGAIIWASVSGTSLGMQRLLGQW
jgi:uncharacterized integral membrane protein (TIGR00698 family)